MTDQKQAEFTLGEQRYVERAREAQAEGLSLRDYYLAHGLSLRMLLRVQRQLAEKGMVLPPSSAAVEAGKPGKLIEVRVAAAVVPAQVPASGAVCRLRHPSGWLIECGMWPDPRWLSGLMEVRS